jgi:hypothetical protein
VPYRGRSLPGTQGTPGQVVVNGQSASIQEAVRGRGLKSVLPLPVLSLDGTSLPTARGIIACEHFEKLLWRCSDGRAEKRASSGFWKGIADGPSFRFSLFISASLTIFSPLPRLAGIDPLKNHPKPHVVLVLSPPSDIRPSISEPSSEGYRFASARWRHLAVVCMCQSLETQIHLRC